MTDDFEIARRQMVDQQLCRRGVSNARVLEAMRRVPRERFVPEAYQYLAYADRPVPIGNGQTISQPLIVGMMLEALELHGDERVLDVGTGSGYQAALLSVLAAEVISVEVVDELATRARGVLESLGCANVRVVNGDGSMGYADAAPYDAIVVAASSPRVPQALVDQLADGGRLVLPVGNFDTQELLRLVKRGSEVERTDLGGCAFVPLIGQQGWPDASPPRPWYNR